MSRFPLLLALLLSISVTTFAQSQANTGNIEGRVTDPNAASVPNVTVTATNLATGLQKNAVTNDEGVYRIWNVAGVNPCALVSTLYAPGARKTMR